MSAIEKLNDAIARALDDGPVDEVLAMLLGHVVGLAVELARRHGHDASKPIKIDGGKNRDVTISGLKQDSEHARH